MSKKKRRKKKHLKLWVKIVLAVFIMVPCFFFAKDVYAEYFPFTSITCELDSSLDIHYNAVDHTFSTDDGLIQNTQLNVELLDSTSQTIQTDENGMLVTGLWNDGANYYLYDDNGYLQKESTTYNDIYYEIHEDGKLYNNEWKEKQWFEKGNVVGKDTSQLLFIQGEMGFYYLDSNNEGKKLVNSSITLSDGREVRFDENGNIVTKEVYESGIYYFPVCEASEEATETVAIPVDTYTKNIDVDGMRLINHRGYHVNEPEDTLAAYKASKEMNYHYVETDVQLTSDNVPVLIHNQSLQYMTGVNINIDSITLDQAKTYSFKGEEITTLEEFIAYCKANLIIPYIELKVETIKTSEQVKLIYDVVEKYGLVGKVEWISFSKELLDHVAQYDTQDKLGYVVGNNDDVQIVQSNALAMKESGLDVFIDARLSKQYDYVDFCKGNDIPLELWDVNDWDSLNSLNDYISGVTTDYLTN